MKTARNYTAPYTATSLKEHIAEATTTTATCWKLISKPNSLGAIKTIAATSHTRDLVLTAHPGLTFLSAQGIVPSAVDTEAGLGSAGLELDAVFVVDTLSEESIASGDWDSAYFEVFIINYETPTMGEYVTFAGYIGDVKSYGQRFRAEGRPLSSKSTQEIGNLYVPKCIARNLGDSKCKVNLNAPAAGDGGVITVTGTVTGGASNIEFLDSARTEVNGYFDYGIIEFTSGVLAGRLAEVQSFIGSAEGTVLRMASDTSWKQSSTFTAGWMNSGFADGAWTNSTLQGANGTIPWGIRPGFPSDSTGQWIWSNYSINTNVPKTVYFRKKFTPNVTSATLRISGDDQYTAYLDGVQVGSNVYWTEVDVIPLTFTAGVEHVLAIAVTNTNHATWNNNPGGLLADITFARYSPVSSGGTFRLSSPMPRIIANGTTYKAIRGCDRNWTTCKNTYNNILNFRGFPFVPGIEKAYKVNQQG